MSTRHSTRPISRANLDAMRLLACVLTLLTMSCGEIDRNDGGSADSANGSDSGMGSDLGDASPEGSSSDGGVCDPNRPYLNQNENCDSTLNAICQQWAQTAAVSAYGYSQCEVNSVTGRRECTDPGCAPQCFVGQVCASTSPTGPRQCIPTCAGK